MVDTAYQDQPGTSHSWCRTFSSSVDDADLKWHRDHQTRHVTVLSGKGWQFQFDDELPFLLTEKHSLVIPQGVFHRIIKGSGDLVLQITESQQNQA
jgi:quercetin dioxygenase-like cupin family protein